MSSNLALNEINSIVDKLYEKFLLRDVFAKIVPGTLLLFSCIYSSSLNYKATMDIMKVSWIIMIGLAWTLGFVVQGVGELLRIIKYYTKDYTTKEQWYEAYIKFKESATREEKSNCERFVVIKEATGNLAMSLLISLIMINLSFYFNNYTLSEISGVSIIFSSVVTLILVAVLIYMHRVHVTRQCSFIETVNRKIDTQRSS